MSERWTIARRASGHGRATWPTVECLEPRELNAVLVASYATPGASLAYPLKAALEYGRIEAQGRQAQLDMMVIGSYLQPCILEESAYPIPLEFWQGGGDFKLDTDDEHAGKGGEDLGADRV